MSIKLYNMSCKDLKCHIKPNSVDLILTDPPYPKKFLHCWSELSDLASYSLKPGGSLMALSGNCWIPEVLDLLRSQDDLVYHWTLSLSMISGTKGSCIGRNVYSNEWKPVFWFRKLGKSIPKSMQIKDVIISPKGDKRFHHWGQNEDPFIELIQRFVNPGALIVDPFLGGGTTAIAAELTGCNFIGSDIDNECLKVTEKRLKTMQLRLFY